MSKHVQDWNAPGLYRDIVAVAVEKLSKQQMLEMAEQVKAHRGYEFTPSGF